MAQTSAPKFNRPISQHRTSSLVSGVPAAAAPGGPAAAPAGPAAAARPISGPERAAVLLLALGNEHGSKIWAQLDDDELRQLGAAMSQLGTITAETVESLMIEFVTRLSGSGAVMGNYDATERLLKQFLTPERVVGIMDEIRGPAGRNMWEKLSHVQEDVLANYLKNEYPQTIAVVLSKLSTAHAARVLAILPEEVAIEVVTRMLKMDPVQKDVMERLEQALRNEFISNLARTRRRDAHEVMAEVFNSFDRQTETRLMASLEDQDKEAAENIKKLMFTFEDLAKLDNGAIQTLMRQVDKEKLAVALKGANESIRRVFLSNMSQRAGKMLTEDMEALGPVRLKDVDEAQTGLVNIAKELAAKGEIMIVKNNSEEELVY
jgi:flagellar motor switch protein FliG